MLSANGWCRRGNSNVKGTFNGANKKSAGPDQMFNTC
jgi:hypothetical protein